MTIKKDRPHLTVDEIGVLRELVKWRRTQEIEYTTMWGGSYRFTDKRAFTWLTEQFEATCMKVGMTPDYPNVLFRWHRVDSVKQALDLLVAFGYLPPRFSSAYRAGWDAWYEDEIGEARPPRRDDAVPAWGPAW